LRLPANPRMGWPKSIGAVRSYERLLAPLREQRIALLELGVAAGDSLAMWRDGFPQATIVGIDVEIPEVDLGPRVHLVEGDQRDGEVLTRVRESFAPEGFDVIIDDASHRGAHSARTMQALFVDHLRPGGLYVIEDWRVGYVVPLKSPLTVAALDETVAPEPGEIPIPSDGGGLGGMLGEAGLARMPSHDYGLVGFVKRLMDHLGAESVRAVSPGEPHDPLPVESLTITDDLAVLRRASGDSA
jgi:hypothetical protein